jgi:hypothetical protein
MLDDSNVSSPLTSLSVWSCDEKRNKLSAQKRTTNEAAIVYLIDAEIDVVAGKRSELKAKREHESVNIVVAVSKAVVERQRELQRARFDDVGVTIDLDRLIVVVERYREHDDAVAKRRRVVHKCWSVANNTTRK